MIARLIYLFALLASVLLLGLGMYIQYSMHLQSCGAQVLVRYALMLAGLFALLALITGTGKIVRIAMSAGIGLISLAGAVVAAHQSWPHRVPLNSAAVGVNIDSTGALPASRRRRTQILRGCGGMRQGALDSRRNCGFGVGAHRLRCVHHRRGRRCTRQVRASSGIARMRPTRMAAQAKRGGIRLILSLARAA